MEQTSLDAERGQGVRWASVLKEKFGLDTD